MQLVVTAGLDGWVRCWEMRAMMDADADIETSLDFYIEPIHEFRITPEYGVSCTYSMLLHSMVDGAEYMIYDLRGQLMQISANFLQQTITSNDDNDGANPQCITTCCTSASALKRKF